MLFRDDRRRRLLNEEILGAAAREEEPPAAPSRSTTPRARYAKAADMSQQPRVTDLVPQRKLVLCLWCLLGLGMIAGLEALYWQMPHWAKLTRDGRIAAFDLDGEGSLGAWFTSVLLSLSCLTAVLIYTLRRHRLDDYRGRYRFWLWAALCFLVMSIDEAGSLHEGFKEMMTYLTGQRLAYDPVGDGSLWWVAAYGAVLGLLGLFVLWDVSESWFSGLAFLATGGCYGVAVATQLGFLLPQRGARGVMVEEGCEMLGAACLLLCLVTYARHVIRQIDGTAESKTRKNKRRVGKPSGAISEANAPAGRADASGAAKAAAATLAATPAKVEPPSAASQVRKDLTRSASGTLVGSAASPGRKMDRKR
jgi:hypothetical protein